MIKVNIYNKKNITKAKTVSFVFRKSLEIEKHVKIETNPNFHKFLHMTFDLN